MFYLYLKIIYIIWQYSINGRATWLIMFMSMFFLTFNLFVWSVTEKEVLNCSTLILDFSPHFSFLSVCFLYIVTFFGIYTHWGLICHFSELTPLTLHSLFLVVLFFWWKIIVDIPAFSWPVLVWCIFFHLFTFNLHLCI